jgi:hypothetical protein
LARGVQLNAEPLVLTANMEVKVSV